MNTQQDATNKKYNRWVVVLSIAIPLVVVLLFGVNLRRLGLDIKPLTFLPPIYATINGITAMVLLVALWAIKNKRRKLHEILMKTSIGLSVLFLLMYIAYHITSDSTVYGGEGFVRYVYYFILISHILLSVIIIPFVLITYIRAITQRFELHKKIARITFPLWLYVAISGVIIYLMISPYYNT